MEKITFFTLTQLNSLVKNVQFFFDSGKETENDDSIKKKYNKSQAKSVNRRRHGGSN